MLESLYRHGWLLDGYNVNVANVTRCPSTCRSSKKPFINQSSKIVLTLPAISVSYELYTKRSTFFLISKPYYTTKMNILATRPNNLISSLALAAVVVVVVVVETQWSGAPT